MGRLDGRVAIVTGAGGGIGKEHALLLAKEGACVVVNDIGVRTSADAAVGRRRNHCSRRTGGGEYALGDLGRRRACRQTALDAFGTVDIVVNNATAGGINDIWRFTEEEFDATVDANLKGYFAMIKYAAPFMCRQGRGVIINTSSGSGSATLPQRVRRGQGRLDRPHPQRCPGARPLRCPL